MDGLFDRFPTTEARRALATRLRLPYSDDMQDWEWEVADPNRFAEFIDLYRRGNLTDDELFSLMEVLVQCVEEMLEEPADLPSAARAWSELEPLLLRHSELHISTVQYWSRTGEADPSALFALSPIMRKLHIRMLDSGRVAPANP
jgi:hypothetical protein